MLFAAMFFLVVATIFAIATLVYVGVDVAIEHRNKKQKQEETEEK